MSAKNGKKTDIRYNQQNRIIERFLTDLRATKQVNFSLESCNVCAASCGVEAVGGTWKVAIPTIEGVQLFSQADLMFNYIYSFPTGLPVKDSGNGICENECIENLAFAVNKLSNCTAQCFYNGNNENLVKAIINDLKNNCAVVASYTDNITPGHYICIVDYDKSGFKYYDSWNNNPRNTNGGKLEVFKLDDLIKCIKHRYMSISL